MRLARNISLLIIYAVFLAVVSCTSDSYDTGDGKLSYMRADFVEAYTDAQASIIKAVTDDGETLQFTTPLKVEGISTPDSIYRMLLYYNKVENRIEPISLGNILVPPIRSINDIKDKATDPVQFDSSWKSRNGKYINLGLTIKAGVGDDKDNKQVVGMALESVTEHNDGSKEIRLRFLHNQNGVPEYYSVRTFLSIPTDSIPDIKTGDHVTVTINTYNGEIEKSFRY